MKMFPMLIQPLCFLKLLLLILICPLWPLLCVLLLQAILFIHEDSSQDLLLGLGSLGPKLSNTAGDIV